MVVTSAHEIFRTVEALPDDQVIATKLVGGKVTFIHRRLWPDLLAVATGEREYEVHTESGRHEKRYEPWPSWAKRMKVRATRDVAAARKRIEEAVTAIGGTAKLLPWSAGVRPAPDGHPRLSANTAGQDARPARRGRRHSKQ